MKDTQKLYPQLIYRINSKLSELKIASGIIDDKGSKKGSKKNEQIIAPSVFNPYGRNFHWLVVADDKWEFSKKNDEWFGNIKNHIFNESEQWKEFKQKYYAIKDKIEIKSIEDAFKILDYPPADANDKEKEKYHHALLTVFQFYPVVCHKYIDGIIYRNLVSRADDKSILTHKIDYAIAELLIDKKNKYKLYPWAKVEFYNNGNADETRYSCQENNSKEINQYPVNPDIDKDEIPDMPTPSNVGSNRDPAVVGTDSFFHNYFLPFFAGYEGFKTTDFLTLSPAIFTQFKHILIAPLYDAHIDGEYYGNLCGTLQIPFKAAKKKPEKSKEPNELIQFKKRNLKKLISNSHLLTTEIKESAIFEVLQQPISAETDLLEHFIKYITLVQDWERIMVWKTNDSSAELDYCYKRREGNKWDRCEEAGNAKCKTCKPNIEDLQVWIKKAEDKHLPIAENGFKNKNAKRKALLENLFSRELIPELYPEEAEKYKNTRLIFEYPCYTVFPENEKGDHKLGLHYERQQIDILRQMALQLKVKRETMKHGTKAAVAAIISRNHSHHIGSHVVPRTDIKKIEERIKKLSCGNYSYNDKTEPKEVVSKLEALSDIVNILKGRLDEYVQKKADFVAEIATEPLTTTKNIKLFDEVILGFINNVLLMDNLGANESVQYKNCCNNRLKLYFKVNGTALTAKYKATGCTKNEYFDQQYPYATKCQCCCNKELQRDSITPAGKDVNIAVPGSLGEFAFFAFLENFIRNGIKHNKKSLDDKPDDDFHVQIELNELVNNDKNEFYKVEVYDNFSDPEKEISVEDIDGNGKKTEKKIKLPEYLQSCVQKPIVNDDGSLRKEAWGIAEMKIMATLLRGSSDFSEMAENLKVKSIKKDSTQRLVYEFYVMKPKNVAIIGTKSYYEEAQKKQGIWWFDSLDEYEKHISNGNSPASFKFLIIDKNLNDVEKKKLKEIKKCLPFRILINDNYKNDLKETIYFNSIDQLTIDNLRNDNSGSTVLNSIWQKWMEQFISRKCNGKKPHLFLFFQQDEAEEPTRSWSNVNNISDIDISVLTKTNGILGANINNHNNKSLLVYDRHFGGYSGIQNKNRGLVDKIDFHEAFDKNSSDFIHLFTPYNNSPEKVYELVEAGLLKILVMDERIAEVAHNELKIDYLACQAYGGQGRIFAAKKAGIYICTHVCVDDAEAQPLHLSVKEKMPSVYVKFKFDGDGDSDKSCKIDVLYQNGGEGCEKIQDIDILIIHQGVLENFLKDKLNDRKDYNAFLESIQRTIPYVVIDSGRGIPAKLPDAAKFLPFSLLEDFLMKDRIAKFSLTKNVMSLIRRKQYE